MTPAELKRRRDSGVKQRKSVRTKIREQEHRVCAQRGCHESLAFERSNMEKCAVHRKVALAPQKFDSLGRPKKRLTTSEVRRINKAKKLRFYERHGIKFDKTIRKRTALVGKEAKALGTATEYDGQLLIYENYKEPLKAIPKTKGHGYYGTIAATDDGMYIQCHICGHLYTNLSMHIRLHKISGEKYREEYGLATGTALVSELERERRQQLVFKPWDGKLPDHLVEYNRKVQSGEIKHPGNKGKNGDKRGSWTLEKRNKEGLCPDQVLEKIRELADKLGRVPGEDDFRAEYGGRYMGSIRFQHGSWTNAVHKLGMKTLGELRAPDSESLLTDLVDFKERHGRIPMTSDFNRGLLRDRGVYIRKFGSLNNARIEAGLNAVIPMPFGKLIELTPDEYFAYKRGEQTEKIKDARQYERKKSSRGVGRGRWSRT